VTPQELPERLLIALRHPQRALHIGQAVGGRWHGDEGYRLLRYKRKRVASFR
jgi:hypothetical protein